MSKNHIEPYKYTLKPLKLLLDALEHLKQCWKQPWNARRASGTWALDDRSITTRVVGLALKHYHCILKFTSELNSFPTTSPLENLPFSNWGIIMDAQWLVRSPLFSQRVIKLIKSKNFLHGKPKKLILKSKFTINLLNKIGFFTIKKKKSYTLMGCTTHLWEQN